MSTHAATRHSPELGLRASELALSIRIGIGMGMGVGPDRVGLLWTNCAVAALRLEGRPL